MMIHASQRIPYQLRLAASKMPASWRWSLSIWLIYRLFISIWAASFWKFGLIPWEACIKYYWGIPPIVKGWEGALIGVWQRWDAIHYIRIAQNGYISSDVSAFFPLYPVLGRLLSTLMNNQILIALLVISNLSLIFAFVLLYQFVENEFSPAVAKRTLVFLAVFPTSFFFLAPYPHSLSLLLVLITYLAAHQSRWGLAFLAGLLAGLTHSTVLPLVLALGFESYAHWRETNSANKGLLLVTPLGPAIGASVFIVWRMVVGLPPLAAMLEEYWGRIMQAPWKTLMEAVQLYLAHKLLITTWINIALILIVIIIAIWGMKFFSPSLNIYMFSSIIYLLLFTTIKEPFGSLGRYILLMFPFFIGLSVWAKTFRRRILSFSLGVFTQLILLSAFTLWLWVE